MFFTKLYKTWLYVKSYFESQNEQPFNFNIVTTIVELSKSESVSTIKRYDYNDF